MSQTKPTLALLIPAYNAAWCLPRLLKSAHAQAVPFDQIWVYDDCSTDGTIAVAESHGAQVLRGTVNKGCSAGKNALARHVDADWVHFHDADDALLPNFVERAHIWMERGDRDIVLFPYEWRDNETNELLATSRFDHDALVADARRYTITTQINPFCGLYRRVKMLAAGGYDEDPLVLYNEDVAFHVRMAFQGLTYAADSEICVINYRVGGSMSAANQAKCAVAHYNVIKKVQKLYDVGDYRKEIGASLWCTAGRLAAYNEWSSARACVELARKTCLPSTSAGKLPFRLLASISPIAAIQLRETLIRIFSPNLRKLSSLKANI